MSDRFCYLVFPIARCAGGDRVRRRPVCVNPDSLAALCIEDTESGEAAGGGAVERDALLNMSCRFHQLF